MPFLYCVVPFLSLLRLVLFILFKHISYKAQQPLTGSSLAPKSLVNPTGFNTCNAVVITVAGTCFAKSYQSGTFTGAGYYYMNDNNNLCAPSCLR